MYSPIRCSERKSYAVPPTGTKYGASGIRFVLTGVYSSLFSASNWWYTVVVPSPARLK